MTGADAIAALRKRMNLTLEQFGALIGVSSKGNVSVIERSGRCSLDVALAIERLSNGAIDAALLCDGVARARAPVAAMGEERGFGVHAAADSEAAAVLSPGKAAADTGHSPAQVAA